MKVLGLESSGRAAGIAIVENGEIVAEFLLNAGITHSQTFLPMLDTMFRLSGMELKEIEAIAVSQGPGSYTGLRIGIATAKGLALTTDKPVVPISTLYGLAQNISDFSGRIFALIFARTQELYYAEYQSENGELMEIKKPQVILLAEIIERMQKVQSEGQWIAPIGDGFLRFEREIVKELKQEKLFLAARSRHQLSAASIALLGEKEATAGRSILSKQLVPTYLKKTQAEREHGE